MKRFALLFLFVFLLQTGTVHTQNTDYSPAYKTAIGEAFVFYQKKEFDKSLAAFEKAFAIYDKDAIDLYNAACLSSLLNNQKKAYRFLAKGIKNGYLDTEWMAQDADLDALKKTKYWKKIPKLLSKAFGKIEKDFEIVQKIPLTDLVPFQLNGKWGYLNKADKTIAVPANYYSVSFGGNCLKIQPSKGIRLRVRPGGEVSSHHLFKKRRKKDTAKEVVQPRIVKDKNFKGFKVVDGKVTEISWIFTKQDETIVPFKINGNWYIVANNRGKWGIIDENGKPLKDFKFVHNKLRYIQEFKGGDLWFYFEDSSGNKGFINTAGKKRFYKAFDNYPFSKPCVMHLAKVEKNGKQGIIDLETLKWLLEPIAANIVRVDYSYSGDCDKTPVSVREVVKDFYVLVKNNAGEAYYIGDGNSVFQIRKQ